MRRILHYGKCILVRVLSGLISLFFIVDKRKAFFCSFLGKSYSDNPRAISEKLHDIDPNIKIVWAFNDVKSKKDIVPNYVICVKNGSIRHLYHELTAGFWIDNYCKSGFVKKRNNQFYIQTWHGDRAIKKILADSVVDRNSFVLFESSACDIITTGSKFGVATLRSAFKYNGEIINSGSPRNDFIVNNEGRYLADVFRDTYTIPAEKKLLLYAPTFRDNNPTNSQNASSIDFDSVIKKLEDITGKKWGLVVRGHTGRKLNIIGDIDIIDASLYEDTRDVLLAVDIVITDYSSIGTDFFLSKKPVILFIEDIDDYKKNNRALYFDVEMSPFMYAKNQNELMMIIGSLNDNLVYENYQALCDYFGITETGHATKDVCDYIMNKLSN